MAGPSIGTWVKVRNKSGRMTSRVIPNKFGGAKYEQGQVITQSEYNAYKAKRDDIKSEIAVGKAESKGIDVADPVSKKSKRKPSSVPSINKTLPIGKSNIIDYSIDARKQIISQSRKMDDPALGWLDVVTGVSYAHQTGRLSPSAQLALYKVKGNRAGKLLGELRSNQITTTDDIAKYLNQRFG